MVYEDAIIQMIKTIRACILRHLRPRKDFSGDRQRLQCFTRSFLLIRTSQLACRKGTQIEQNL